MEGKPFLWFYRVHMCSDVVVLAVGLTESRITYEMGPWECLIGTEAGRPIYCGRGHSLSAILD